MVHAECLAAEHQQREHREDRQRHHLLNDLELDERERPAVARESEPVGRHLKAVFEKRDAPTDEDQGDQGQMSAAAVGRGEFEVAVPCDGHEYVCDHQQADGVEGFHAERFAKKSRQKYKIFCLVGLEITFFRLPLHSLFGTTSQCEVEGVTEGNPREFSSAGSEHLPYKQRVGGSNPSTPTGRQS